MQFSKFVLPPKNLSNECSTHDNEIRENLYYTITTEIGFKRTCGAACPDCLKRRECMKTSHPQLPMNVRPMREPPRSLPPPQFLRGRVMPGRIAMEPVKYFMSDEMVLRRGALFQFLTGTANAIVGCQNGYATQKVATKVKVLDGMPSSEYFIERFDNAFNRVRSVTTLKLQGWRIDENIFRYLTIHPSLKNVREVHFLHCVMTMTKDVFLAFLQSRTIKEIYLWSRFREFGVDDSCLMNSETIYLNGGHELQNSQYPGITDTLLEEWTEKAPIKVDLKAARTKFTLKGLMELLKTSVASNSQADYRLGRTFITREDIPLLFRTTRELRKLTWKIETCYAENWNLECRIANNDKFFFVISLNCEPVADFIGGNRPSGGSDGKKFKQNKKEMKSRNTPNNKNMMNTRSATDRKSNK